MTIRSAQRATSDEPRDVFRSSTPSNPRVVGLEDVHFAYADGTPVLDGISLSIAPGEIVGVVGPSGCGKSTLLSLTAGLAQPTSGRVERNLADAGRHALSMVFQRDTILPWLTASENVRFFARFKTHGLRPSAPARLVRRFLRQDNPLDERVLELLAMTGLAERADAYPYQLSGGMRRRLAFLTAVAVNPQVLLLDEPFSSVDEPTRIEIHQDVFRIARLMQMTTILVTHDLAEAITLCDRVLILSNRPARIAREQTIPFGEERQMLKLRETDTYLGLYRELWHALAEQITAGRNAEGAVAPGQLGGE